MGPTISPRSTVLMAFSDILRKGGNPFVLGGVAFSASVVHRNQGRAMKLLQAGELEGGC